MNADGGLEAAELQRGRARAGAERTIPAVCLPSRWRRFNGAAPARARRAMARRNLEIVFPWLQRGRARAGAESADQRERQPETVFASTGPRPRGRGEPRWMKPTSAWRSCFNGAAPARARRVIWISFH